MNLENQWAATEELLERQADSLGELLVQLRGRISPVLIGDPEWERLLERAHPMPATMAAFPFGFELPLHEARPKVDLGVSLYGGSRSAAFFAERGQSEDANPSMARIAWLLDQTRLKESPLRRVAGRKMLLEYDVPLTECDAFPDPGIFLYPDEGVLVGDRSDQRLQDLGVVVDAVVSGAGWNLDPAECRQVERVYLAMEPDTSIRAVGAFPSRSRAIWLAITGFRKTSDVMAFLERAGWPGQGSMVASIVSPLEEHKAFAYLGVHFDVLAGGAGPTLGLSFYAQEGQWLKDFQPWTSLMEGIHAAGFAVPEKLSALADSSCGAEALFGKSDIMMLLRGIHHIKLVLTGEAVEQVKAYTFFWMRRVQPLGGNPAG